MNDSGNIYYVTNYDGQCAIWEINTAHNDNIPQKVYEQRSSTCNGFCVNGLDFYFIDDAKVINKLE